MLVQDHLTATLTAFGINQLAWVIRIANWTLRGEDPMPGLNMALSVVSAYGPLSYAIFGSFDTAVAPWLEGL
jgi:hypothetical protein